MTIKALSENNLAQTAFNIPQLLKSASSDMLTAVFKTGVLGKEIMPHQGDR